ncbi:hypothetical protein JGH11_17640 [Dysgonomonas sp. Marseille-P4677]|uniref:hypothetical protein n=1 Tax=Dysgonomonas sp. Marseille-P4677 TaxID=2364790 RepID=UPI00191364C7|nr:hypothetical protein [Dysgonomonas sp. Marseille-P4677]MBK5722699.1 hypothetical protein [Dysgonomonas sp. Marseille-P4677]
MYGTDINLSLEVKGLGTTKITITDKSQNSLTLDVIVDYLTYNFVVVKHDILIVGGNLTENEKKAISEEYLTEIPVKVGGGYRFIFTDLWHSEGGEALIYTDKFGDNAIETTFEKGRIVHTPVYEIIINDVKRIFAYGSYVSPTKSDMIVPVALFEDITPIVKAKYPNAELVLSEQKIEPSTN